jgi:hypothetical protein
MAVRRSVLGGIWVGLILAISACELDSIDDVPGGSGAGGAAGSAASAPSAGAAVDLAGSGGVGAADSGCQAGLHTLRSVRAANGAVVVWSEQRRIAVSEGYAAIGIFDVRVADGELTPVVELPPSAFGLPSDWDLQPPLRFGGGLIVTATHALEARFFSWSVTAGVMEIELPLTRARVALADPSAGLAVLAGNRVYRAHQNDGAWTVGNAIGEADQRRAPLAFEGSELLVGLGESDRLDDSGAGGEAGSGGWSARVERWNEEGQRTASYPAVGDPSVALPVDGGWLIGETNSYWGSHRAALEWLAPGAAALQTLTPVPVRSEGDGTDGAYGLVLDGRTVFVANCESGLLRGDWQGSSIDLSALGPVPRAAVCDPTSVALLDDLLIIGGEEQASVVRVCNP